MDYQDIKEDKLPQAVRDELFKFIQLEPPALIEKVLSWKPFYGRWAILCRTRSQSNRISYINNGTFLKLAEQYTADDEVAGTLMATLWCMPDTFLDDVIKIYQAAKVA